MDDDIDIEEHDVMDNPRIKSIFPDLSRVKIEIPDEEDFEEQCDEMSVDDEPQEMRYQYEYSFETTTDNIAEEDAEYGEHNGYFYNNEIILGTKPPPDPDVLYEEALNSHPIVYLENWELKLVTSPCYCDTCQILFPTVNALDAHKMISHSYLVALDIPQRNTARKSTVTSKYCNHCSKTFPDDTSLIKHLYELLPLNDFPKVEEIKEEPESKPQFLCQKCKQTFVTHSDGKLHKKLKHPSLSHVNNLIIRIKPKIEPVEVKIQPKKIKIEPVEVKIEATEPTPDPKGKPNIKYKIKLSREGKFFASSSLVPKSTLFLCNVCQIGFMSCFSAIQHSKMCEKVLSWEKCSVCKRKIRSKEMKIHELQHNYTDKLKIYTVSKNLYERVLCKCPKCSSCLDEIGFWAHYEKCKKSEIKATHCSVCDLNIASNRFVSHKLRHSAKKLTKKDFIIIEFHDQNNINQLTDKKIEVLRKQRLKERNKKYQNKKFNRTVPSEKNITLYYCEFCGCCQYILQYKGHADGACRGTAYKKFCDKCGLCFTSKSIESHALLHEKKSFSLKDIKIVSLTTGAEIEPPMPQLLKCKTCEKHFLYKRLARNHDCKAEKFITCKICTKKFNMQAYRVHKLFHTVDKLIPELMKKYNSINNMWNVIYMCLCCELVTSSYDSAVTHSQGHLNYIISDLHKNCRVCDLRIAMKDFSNHEMLHENNDSLKRQSFRILKYNYKDLFKKEWLALFKPLPKEHRQQILSKSIYRYTRGVKMQIEVSAPTDDTKYFCMNCKSYVDGAIITQHIKTKCTRNNKYVCDICHEIFKSFKKFSLHEGSHENVAKPHTIVTFNNECDQEFNNHLSLIETQSIQYKNNTPAAPKSKLRELLTDSVKKTYKIYKCARCLVCVSLKDSVQRHNCVGVTEKKFCDICQQFFSSKKLPMHMEAHRKKPSVNKDTLSVVYFNCDKKVLPTTSVTVKPQKQVTVNVAKVFKCSCGLHFTSMKTIQKHLDICTPELEVSKETCSKCNLIFSTDVLVTHLVNHHSKDIKIDIQNVLKVNLLKCPHCLLLFTDEDNFNDHMHNCDPKNGRECMECHLSFDKKCFAKHICSTDGSTCIAKITNVKSVYAASTVFKCGRCNICYLQYKSFKYHLIEVKHKNKATLHTCGTCGLRFTSNSYHKHEKIHYSKYEEYKIKVIDPVIGDSEVIVGNNPCKNEPEANKRKRRNTESPNTENEIASVKKVKLEVDINSVPERKSKRITKSLYKASTSKDSTIDFYEEPDHTNENINNMDDETIVDYNNDSTKELSAISNKLKSRIIVHKYDKRLYNCIYCNQHFMKYSSFDYHIKTYMSHEKVAESFKCDECGLDFSKNTLPRHVYVHHQNMNLHKEDFEILYETPYTKETKLFEKIDSILNGDKINSVPKIDVSVEIINESGDVDENRTENAEESSVHQVTSENVASVNNSESIATVNNSENVGNVIISESIASVNVASVIKIERIATANKTENVAIENNSASLTSEINKPKLSSDKESEKICYYKCLECNVCFINPKVCYDHTLKHEILDPKVYIECKLCNFQFMIDSLKEHMDLHHNSDFMIENLIIHEYKSVENDSEPKIDVYLAVDKVQSRLISTTTDVGVV